MKTEVKKVPRNFRLEAELDRELNRRSKETGLTETKIVEIALRNHFASNMRRTFTKVVQALKPGKTPAKRVRGAEFESATPTVSKLSQIFSGMLLKYVRQPAD